MTPKKHYNVGNHANQKYCPEYADHLVEWCKTRKKYPTFEGWRAEVEINGKKGVFFTTFYRWIDEHPEFAAAVQKAKDIQKDYLITGALDGSYNANFAKFYAVNNFGMHSESIQADVKSEEKNEITIKVI